MFQNLLALWLLVEILSVPLAVYRAITGKKVAGDRFYIAPLLAAAIISGATALIQTGVGVAQKAKAAKLARQNKMPLMEDNPYTEEAIDITRNQAGKGISDVSMQGYNTAADRALSSSINAVMKSGGSSNNIADLYDNSQSTLRSLVQVNDEAKQRNVTQYLTAGLKPGADQSRDQWYLNKYVPYKDTAALSASLSQQGQDDIWRGVSGLGETAAGYFKDKLYADDGRQRGRDNILDMQLATKLNAYKASKIQTAPLSGDPSRAVAGRKGLVWSDQLQQYVQG